MDIIKITGGKELSGAVDTNCSKNGAMALLCGALLNSGTTTLHGIPAIEEVERLLEVFASIGVKIERPKKHTVILQAPKKFSFNKLDKKSAGRIRSSLMMIGALIHCSNDFSLPHSGGCRMGERTIAAHRMALEAFGVTVNTERDAYHVIADKTHPAQVTMYEASDTGTENALLAAAGVAGKSTIYFGQQNYMVQDLCFFLEALGIKIDGIGSHTLTVHGKKSIKKNIEWHNSEDPIESMMFISAALVTHSNLTIKRCPIDFLRRELLVLEAMGAKFTYSKEYLSRNKRTKLVDITVVKNGNLKALKDKIHATPYPGINSDNLPFFVPVVTMARGTTLVHDWMWENRAIYFTELNKLGADVRLADPHRVLVTGPTKLIGTTIICPPALRPSTMIMVAMLGAEGVSHLHNVYPIKRGYEGLVERFNALGAEIEEV